MLNVNQNDNLGYGKNIIKNNIIAIISVGYADGIQRKLFKNGHVFIGDKKCKIIANVCMDCLLVDITKTDAKLNDEVIIMDNAQNFAKWTKTSPYEILTNFNSLRTNIIIK